MSLALAVAAGALIGLSIGALGGGGSILAVPVLIYAFGQSPAQATTGSLVVVAVTALIGAVTAHREGNVLVSRGLIFGVVGIGGAAIGGKAAAHVPEPVLLAAFAVLMLLVGTVMAVRQLRHQRESARSEAARDARRWAALDDPIITFSPTEAFGHGQDAVFICQCPLALKVLLSATSVGLLTGFLGVGGGFLVVPVMVLALGLPMDLAAGTSLVAITLMSTAALVVRAGVGVTPDWAVVLTLTGASAVGGLLGARLAARTKTARLSTAFTALVLAVALYTASQALPALP